MTMTPIFGISSLLDSSTLASLLLWLARATVIAAMACAFLALARRVRPATRCVIAVASVCAIVMLPAASAILPVLSVPMLPAEPAELPEPTRAQSVPYAIDIPSTAASSANASTDVYAARVTSEPTERATPVTTPAPARKALVASIARAIGAVVVGAAASLG